MPPKTKIAAPIDRPLSKAYLRKFTGWSSAYPPGQSDPTSVRKISNMMVDRNGALVVRPGLKYLSYATPPEEDEDGVMVAGTPIDRPLVGTQEAFYLNSGEKALLFAVREVDETVGFRVLRFTDHSEDPSDTATPIVYALSDPEVGFSVPQGEAVLNFSAATTYVTYLQIDNKIVALSDAGESMRMFFVGSLKLAKKLNSITAPTWAHSHKLSIIHPEAGWITQQNTTTRTNLVRNPSGASAVSWSTSPLCELVSQAAPTIAAQSGSRVFEVRSKPTRTNLAPSPLHSVVGTGTTGYYPDSSFVDCTLSEYNTYLRVSCAKKGFFRAYSALMPGVVEGAKYRVAYDSGAGSNVKVYLWVGFYSSNGALIGNRRSFEFGTATARRVTPAITAPAGAVSMRIYFGGESLGTSGTYVLARNVVVCRDGESTAAFHGSSGTDYFWTGTPNKSASTYHPVADIAIACSRGPVLPSKPLYGSAYMTGITTAREMKVQVRAYDKDGTIVHTFTDQATPTKNVWSRIGAGGTLGAAAVTADLRIEIPGVLRGEKFYIDSALLEPGAAAAGTYFDGSTAGTTTTTNRWEDASSPHNSISTQVVRTELAAIPTAETPTAATLVATGGASANPYKVAFFYTFENEIGESAPSRITETRVKRPWSNWVWETPNAAGEPSGTYTENDRLCADQLVAIIPADVYAQAVAEGAVRWNLYAMSWSDQDPVPVTAQQVGTKELAPLGSSSVLAYEQGGWLAVTPARNITLDESELPSESNRTNYSRPPRARQGLVAGDRMILVGDEDSLATIRWTSNRAGQYTNFTANKGGGAKTLTTGNLFVPVAVELWQNPQSVDTLTVLCTGIDGQTASFYMAPASINAQSGTVQVMGFEETTNTPGSAAAYGVEVLNNALYRPLDVGLVKSTASNYNINHKTLTDDIANMWSALLTKQWILSAQLDNRLYFLVNNPFGGELEPGCKGNEIWVYDNAAEAGSWTRLQIQGTALRVLEYGDRIYLSVTRPDGLYYLDPACRMDEVVLDGAVVEQQIPWSFETNTQGANRAHDAWAHLQQVQVTLGSFLGALRYGIRGWSINHREVEVWKIASDDKPAAEDGSAWDFDDMLQVRRDLKEWYFFAESVEGRPGTGQIGVVQYRYTPVSVNVGYEYGSVETFEYGNNVLSGNTDTMVNGIPSQVVDPWRP